MENRRFTSIRAARDFENLRNDGQVFHPSRWLMVSYRFQDLKEVRCAWTISRAIGPAVVRNRFRRWGREFFRDWVKTRPGSLDFNLIFKRQNGEFYRQLDHTDFDQVLRKVVKHFENATS